MADTPFLNDFRVQPTTNSSTGKITLALSPTGDLQLVSGTEKLASQLMRAVINDSTSLRSLINSRSGTKRVAQALFTLILRNFRQSQYTEVVRSDPNFKGFSFYRKASGTNSTFRLVSTGYLTYKFVDTGLTNNSSYDYGITKVYGDSFETDFVENFTVTPSQFSNSQKIQIGQQILVFPGDRQVTFYVDYNKVFKGSEILDQVDSIIIEPDPNEPRRLVVNITVLDLRGNPVSISTQSVSAITQRA